MIAVLLIIDFFVSFRTCCNKVGIEQPVRKFAFRSMQKELNTATNRMERTNTAIQTSILMNLSAVERLKDA
jgi:hypothetical protein